VPRVEHGNHLLRLVLRQARVRHGRADVLVPEVLLDHPQVSAVALQQFDAARMAESMRVKLGDSGVLALVTH
jgi:hypothetical protein